MFTLEEVKSRLKEYVGTDVAGDYFTDVKIQKAASASLREILIVFKPEEYYEADTPLLFSGDPLEANAPSNFLIWVKLFKTGFPESPWNRVKINQFDLAPSQAWTSRLVSGVNKFYKTGDETNMMLRFIAKQDEFEGEDLSTNQILLPYYFLDAVSEWTASEILRSASREEWQEKKQHAEHAYSNALSLDSDQKIEPSFRRVQSVYETRDLFRGH